MNEFQKDLFRRSLTELYHFSDSENTLVINKLTEKIYLKKELAQFHEEVFRYLLTHHHPNLPYIYDYYRENEKLVVIEEFISGLTVREALDAGSLTEERKREIVRGTAAGLAFLHKARPAIIHRDVKAENILLTEDGGVKLIDYDAARSWQRGLTRDTVLMGTAGFAAPEQYGFGQSDERTDVYGLGCLMRELGLDGGRTGQIIKRATEIDPEKRYRNIESLCRELEGERFSFWPLPGFRSRTPWKMVLAVFGYSLLLWLTFSIRITGTEDAVENTVSRLCFFAAGVMITDCMTGWSPLYERLPFRHSDNRALGALVMAAAALGAFIFWAAASGLFMAVWGTIH